MSTPCINNNHQHCIESALQRAEKVCRESGARFTSARRRVLELIWQNHHVVSAYDLLAQLQKDDPSAKPPTVYRALDFLLEQGLIHRVSSMNAFTRCDCRHESSDFQLMICNGCKRVQEIHIPDLPESLKQYAQSQNFNTSGAIVEIHGLCQHCQSIQAN